MLIMRRHIGMISVYRSHRPLASIIQTYHAMHDTMALANILQ